MKEDVFAESLQGTLGYRFSSPALLEQALTHRSFANESGGGIEDNERLEFLGDAVLDLVISHMLMDAHPDLSEGELSNARASLVSESALSAMAARIDLGRWLRFGKGEERAGGNKKPSLLADALEAVLAATYLDGGFEASRRVVKSLFADAVQTFQVGDNMDYKTQLQEMVQAKEKRAPTYKVVGETGPDHAKVFTVAVLIGDKEIATAEGKTKKAAEQLAASLAVSILER